MSQNKELSEKIPPQNIEAEQSLLGALLIDKDAITRVADAVTTLDFYKTSHAIIFEAMLELYEKQDPIDLLSLGNRLDEKKSLETVGGRSYLIGLAQIVPTSSNVVHYASIIHKKATLRRLQTAASEITELSYTDDDIEQVLDKAEERVFAVSQKLNKQVFTPLKTILGEAFERIDEIHKEKGKLRGIPTGFSNLDNLLAGLQKSDLIIIAARPSVGKTSFALDIARKMSIQRKASVGIFSLEMSKEQLVDRLICAEAGVDLWRMRTGRLTDRGESDDFVRIGHAMNTLSEAKMYIDDSASANILEIKAKARRLQSEHGLDCIIIDYLQLMEGRTKPEGRVQEVAEITRGLKSIARELGIPVVALSQLSRAVEMNKPALPRLAHLRESGCLTGDTKIMDARSGKLYTLKELAERKDQTPIPVYSLDTNWKLVIKSMTKVFSSGKKQVYELRTRSGRTVKASGNHPFRVLSCWRRLDALKENDVIALPRAQKPDEGKATLSDDELIFLAHMLGDGCMLKNQPIHYTSGDPKNISIVAKTARNLFGIQSRIVKQKNWWHTYLPSPYRLTHGKHHPVTEWLSAMGSGLAHSWEKVIPQNVFENSNKKIALFLHHLWATDGNISWRKLNGRKHSGAIYYSTTNYDFACQVQHLLMRFEIQGTVRKIQKGNYRPSYNIWIEGNDSQIRFLKNIGSYGSRGNIVPSILNAIRRITPNTNVDIIPKTAWRSSIFDAKEAAKLTWRDVCYGLKTQYCGTTLFKANLSRERMARVATLCNNDLLMDLATSDVFWDRIVAITPLGVKEVYDATVDETHNFIADDIIVHNSIEQDSDVVIFIYRKSSDKNYRLDELTEEEKHTAEIIVAKHRNGPTGSVKLFWDEKRVSFRSLEQHSQQEEPLFQLPF